MSYYGGKSDVLDPVREARAALDAAQIGMDAALDEARRKIGGYAYWGTDMADVAKAGGVSRATAFRWADRARDRAESQKVSVPAVEHSETVTPASASQVETRRS